MYNFRPCIKAIAAMYQYLPHVQDATGKKFRIRKPTRQKLKNHGQPGKISSKAYPNHMHVVFKCCIMISESCVNNLLGVKHHYHI